MPLATIPLCNPLLVFQPKQGEVLDLVEANESTWIGAGGGRGGAKLLDLDELIPTPDGFVRNGDLKDGDIIFGQDGLQYTVLKAHAIVEEEAFRISFDDGTSTYCHAGHLWHTFTWRDRKALGRCNDEARVRRRATRRSKNDRSRIAIPTPELVGKNVKSPRKGSVKTTQEIADSLFVPSGHHGDGLELTLNHSITVASPIQTKNKELPIDPYVLGCWLGDGSSAGGGYTCHYEDRQIIEEIRKCGFDVRQSKRSLFDDGWHIQKIATQLRALGILCDKHIPHAYLWASPEQRLALLQGLCDTDGTCCEDGQTGFVNTNRRLSEGVYHLAASLGIKPYWIETRAKLNGKDCGPVYKVNWTAILPVFRLSRKLNRIPKKVRATQKWRYITAVEPIGKRPMRCITTSNPSGLYLFGKNFNVTHNSRCLQSVMLARRLENPGTIGAIVMRNSDQVRRYHEDAMLRTWPQLRAFYHKGDRHISLPFQDGRESSIEFTYAETLEDVIRRFRSANYYDIAIDQAEQFTEEELREIKQAVRWPDVPEGTCKFLLSFNMGGVGIGFLRKKFHDLEFSEREDPKRYAFVHFRPYDNVAWCLPALKADGLTEEDYYSWTEAQRREYCATRSDYGKELFSQDPALVERDFDGSWNSLEGAFFMRSFDRNSTVLAPEQVNEIIKPWWERWMSQDWARGHYCITYWNAMGEMSPAEIKRTLGWDVRMGLKVIVTYREYVAGGEAAKDSGANRELDEEDIARGIVERTLSGEREQMHDFFMSPDAFGKESSKNTIAQTQGEILMANGLPWPRPADNELEGGWNLMSKLMLATKRKGQRGDEIWLISANCPELISAIPLAMRDPKRLEVILKTDKSAAKIEMDALDSARYGLKSKLQPGQKPKEVVAEEKLRVLQETGLDEHSLSIYRIKYSQEARAPEVEARMGRGRATRRM